MRPKPVALGENPYIRAENTLGFQIVLSRGIRLLESGLPNTVSTR
jgi:hypothetical protein